MDIEQLVQGIAGFDDWAHAQRLRFFAWYIHRHEEKLRFEVADLRRLYSALSMVGPTNYSQQVTDLLNAKVLLRDGGGLYLERRIRDEFDKKFGDRPARIAVHNLLASLPERVPNVAERVFLNEALTCFSAGVFRAAVVMTWNLAFDHLCTFVLERHLADFNRQWPLSFEKHHRDARIAAVTKLDDFAEFKESQVIKVCRSAGIIPGDVEKVLNRALDRRNSAAHPSGVAIEQLQAEEFIDDVVKNVVLKLGV